MGDFNFPIIEWPSKKVCGGTTSEQEQANHLLGFAENNFLEQIVEEPTRKNNIMDLVLMNNKERIHSHQMIKTIILNHNLVEVRLDIHCEKTHNHEVAKECSECEGLRHINFHSKKANWDAINP